MSDFYQQHSHSGSFGSGTNPNSPCYAPTPVPTVGPNDAYYASMVMSGGNNYEGGAPQMAGGFQPYPAAPQVGATAQWAPPTHLNMQHLHQPGGYQPQYYGQQHQQAHHHQQFQQQLPYGAQPYPAPSPSGNSNSGAGGSKRYAHNPYASASSSEPSTPSLMSPTASFAAGPPSSQSADQVTSAALPPSSVSSSQQQPVYAPESQYTDAVAHPIAHSVSEQFANLKGSICAAACTVRGRHVLISTLRLQHLDKIQAIFEEVAPNFATLVMDANGCHVVRTLIEFLTEAQATQLIGYISSDFVLTMATTSQYTRRILQTLFERHRVPALQGVVDVLAAGAVGLATTQQGCIALMRVLENSTEPQRLSILHALAPHLAALTMDPYGNYVVQTIVAVFPREISCEFLEKAFEGNWLALSSNKFASNVIEKLIRTATPVTRKTVLDELVFNPANLQHVMQDGFGNFVLQSIIDTCTTGIEFRRLQERIKPYIGASPYGHKIDAKLKSKRFGPTSGGGSSNNSNSGSGHQPIEPRSQAANNTANNADAQAPPPVVEKKTSSLAQVMGGHHARRSSNATASSASTTTDSGEQTPVN